MRLGKGSIAGTSLVVLALQLAMVSSIAGKYLYQRWTCPRVWTRTMSYDPSLPLRGRYLSVQLMVDGCASTLPSATQAAMPRDQSGVPTGKIYTIQGPDAVDFAARLKVQDEKLEAVRIPDGQEASGGQRVMASPGTPCDELRLQMPVDFFIAEHAVTPAAKPGQELWMEVTVPPKGPPRPIQLALKESDGAWKPLAFQ